MANDRIKLAEAMGWIWERKPKSWHFSHVYPEMGHWIRPDGEIALFKDGASACGCRVAPPDFDPFTDANDDYAVLEWMRKTYDIESIPDYRVWLSFCHALSTEMNSDKRKVGTYSATYTTYQIGDYARAVLRVIERHPTTRQRRL